MWFPFPSTSAEMTFPSADNDKLILEAYFKRSPVEPVFDCLSDPAKSTKFNFDAVNLSKSSKFWDVYT